MREANVTLVTADPKNLAVLVWYDTIDDQRAYFQNLKQWQIVNRLPNINLICRKAGLVRMFQRLPERLQGYLDFLPKSSVVSGQASGESTWRPVDGKTYIVKPDNGSLGFGIKIVRPGQSCTLQRGLSVAQEYIDPHLLGGKKFDLRVYVLVTNISDLHIYVCHSGVARVCSQEYGTDSPYSQITNTAVNKQNKEVGILEITRLTSEVFADMTGLGNIDESHLWKAIDIVATRTIAAAWGYLKAGEARECPRSHYGRCFQILGFDVLFDSKLKAHLLEVNYRPSLGSDVEKERRLKQDMLAEAMDIAVPAWAQGAVHDMANSNVLSDAQWKAAAGDRATGDTYREPKLFHCAYPSGDVELDRIVALIKRNAEELGADLQESLPSCPSQSSLPPLRANGAQIPQTASTRKTQYGSVQKTYRVGQPSTRSGMSGTLPALHG
jgi:hypothetical protein